MVRNVGKSGLEFLGQTGVPPVTYPSLVSLEVFHCSPQPLKAGIVATALFRRFMEFSMYSQRCIIAGTLVASSVCVLISVRPPV